MAKPYATTAQSLNSEYLYRSLYNPSVAETFLNATPAVQPRLAATDTTIRGISYPKPTSVLYKSLIIPGWGQIVNKQAWKVPIIYALLGGLAAYSVYLTKKYHDYRAAYYNGYARRDPDDSFPDDMQFGPTPAYLEGVNLASLQDNRDFLHNRRDFIYVTIGLAYGLNAIDAYIFAHLRTFDVSKDLSVRATMKPQLLTHNSPGVTLSFKLFKK